MQVKLQCQYQQSAYLHNMADIVADFTQNCYRVICLLLQYTEINL